MPCELDRSLTRLCCFLRAAGPQLLVGLGQLPPRSGPQALLKRRLRDKTGVIWSAWEPELAEDALLGVSCVWGRGMKALLDGVRSSSASKSCGTEAIEALSFLALLAAPCTHARST